MINGGRVETRIIYASRTDFCPRVVAYNFPGKALHTIWANKGESDRMVRVGDNSKVTPIPSIWPTVESAHPLWVCRRKILIWQNVVRYAIDSERRVFDAVRIATGHATKMGILPINAAVGGIVESHNNVALNTPAVADEYIGNTGKYGMNSARMPGAEIMYFPSASGPRALPATVPLLSCAQVIDASIGIKRRSLLNHILRRP